MDSVTSDEKERCMKCPVDDAVLVMSERAGVEIDLLSDLSRGLAGSR